ncbi:MAG: L-aspartate oxidase [Mariprofundaceae bacterium]|nr:L-aspartate oxidase [Mariprofundaceae bacterium]
MHALYKASSINVKYAYMKYHHQHFDYLIIGSGAAGLLAAHQLAPHGTVGIVNKGNFSESNTYQAQGGIAGVSDFLDSTEKHVNDTLQAGVGLCYEAVAQQVAEAGGHIIHELSALGMPFDEDAEGLLHLTQEGGHSHRRIAHAKDATGRAIGETLLKHVQNHANIQCLRQHMAVDLITSHRLGYQTGQNRCLGVYLLNPDKRVITVSAGQIILATGGAGKVYMYTSNPHAATGDGIAMAWRAGCKVMNMEFMQFHPTCLYHASAPTMLLSEALRGEGAHLINQNGHRFVFDYDARGELAPRDIVARAIDHEIKKYGQDCMFLDASQLGNTRILEHFPNIHQRLLKLGLDMRQQSIPVVPAAHYICGGVATNLAGKTDLKGLYVIGESACTGLHGANRLASNSLLECLVMAKECSKHILSQTDKSMAPLPLPTWDESGIIPERERILIKQNWDEIRATMSNYVGIVRSNERLRRARRRLTVIQDEIAYFYWKHPLSRDLIELRNLSIISELIIRSAQQRHESRGLHYSTDYPDTKTMGEDTYLTPE